MLNKIKCANCSKPFQAQRSTARFCSDKCRVTFSRKNANAGVKKSSRTVEDALNDLVEQNKKLKAANFILLADLRMAQDRISQLQRKLGKPPSLADAVFSHINKPTEDRAANLRSIKVGKKKGE